MKNDNQIHIKIISSDETTLEHFYTQRLVISDPTIDDNYPELSAIKYIPGAMGGWYEMAITLGLIAFPASVCASYLANWIFVASSKTDKPKVKLVIRKGNLSIDLDLANVEKDTICDALSKVLDHVDSE